MFLSPCPPTAEGSANQAKRNSSGKPGPLSPTLTRTRLARLPFLVKNGSLASRVLVRVGDNGPGFPEEFRFAWLAEFSAVGGHGLKNIQQRLIAHYGSDTTLQFGRDAFNSATVVFFEIPA